MGAYLPTSPAFLTGLPYEPMGEETDSRLDTLPTEYVSLTCPTFANLDGAFKSAAEFGLQTNHTRFQ